MRLYRFALRLLPPSFRRVYGAAMAADAEGRLREAGGAWARTKAVVRLSVDLMGTLVREWLDTGDQIVMTEMGGGVMTELRQALRAVLRTPTFTAAVVGTLGLGIGATTVALGLVDAYLLRSLPYPDGDQLVSLWPSENWSRQMVDEARDRMPSLKGLAAVGGLGLVIEEGGEPEEIFAAQATTDYFDVLQVHPALGRGFTADDGAPGADAVAILSYELWQQRFGGDVSVLGRSIALGGEGQLRRTVIGVMPEGYHPLQGESVEAWVPVTIDPSISDYGDDYFMRGVGRMAAGNRPEDVARDIRAFATRMHETEPGWFTDERIARATAPSLARERTSDQRTPVLVGLAAALLVLLVACVNVANLVVARTTGRERELSVRAALGAGRFRTARAVLAEVATLAVLGAAAGLALAWLLVQAIERWFPSALPAWGFAVDARWVAATISLALLSALLAGVVPALQAGRRDPARAMSGGRGTSGRRGMGRIQEVLSATQLAMATAGIAAMGLLGRSLLELSQVDPGFQTSSSVTFRVTAPPAAFPEDADVVRFFREADAALDAVPGVEWAGFGSRLPAAGGDSRITVQPEGWTFAEDDPRPKAWHRLATPGYLEALGVRLLAGRIPTVADDRDDAPELVVVNQAAAEQFWPGESAVGKVFYGPGHTVWATVAGVVENVMENGQARTVLPGLYIPHRDWPWRTMYAVVRGRQDPLALLPELKKAIWSVSAGAPISRVGTLEDMAARGLRPTRTLAVLASLAGLVTLLLGALGIYGVVSQTVARRTRELGVRAALGAGRKRLLRGELAGASRIVIGGLTVGLFLAWATGRALRGALFGVAPFDLPSLAGALALLAGVAYLAAYLPARRASSVDPATVMREE